MVPWESSCIEEAGPRCDRIITSLTMVLFSDSDTDLLNSCIGCSLSAILFNLFVNLEVSIWLRFYGIIIR